MSTSEGVVRGGIVLPGAVEPVAKGGRPGIMAPPRSRTGRAPVPGVAPRWEDRARSLRPDGRLVGRLGQAQCVALGGPQRVTSRAPGAGGSHGDPGPAPTRRVARPERHG